MFDFEKLDVFKYSLEYYKFIKKDVLNSKKLERYERDQLGRCALSVLANVAEGNGVYSIKSKANYFRIARGSLSESMALIIVLKEVNSISLKTYDELYLKAERISKMLLALIRKNDG